MGFKKSELVINEVYFLDGETIFWPYDSQKDIVHIYSENHCYRSVLFWVLVKFSICFLSLGHLHMSYLALMCPNELFILFPTSGSLTNPSLDVN